MGHAEAIAGGKTKEINIKRKEKKKKKDKARKCGPLYFSSY